MVRLHWENLQESQSQQQIKESVPAPANDKLQQSNSNEADTHNDQTNHNVSHKPKFQPHI